MSNERLISEALRKTDPLLYSQVDGGGRWTEAIKKNGARVEKYRRYERGDHDQNLTVQQKNLLNIKPDAAGLNESNANYCGIVVDMMAGRLIVSEITSDDESTEKWINNTLQRNQFKSKQGGWYRGAIRDKESYVLVDPQTALWSSEPAYDGYSGVVAIFNSITGLPEWACKLYAELESSDVSSDAGDIGEGIVVKVVVYQPNRISYYQGVEGGIELKDINDKQDEDGSAINWIDWSDIGIIPIAQFANKRDNYTPYGESEIRAVLPLQDVVNATLYDMQMSSKLSAFKIYWSKGIEINKDGIVPGSVINLVPKDKSGNVITSMDEKTASWWKEVEVGEFGETDMSQYTEQLDKLEREISQVSSTPVYGITSQGNLSGEALKQLESGLIGKIYRFQNENTGSIIRLLKITAEIQRQFSVDRSFFGKMSQKISEFLGVSAPERPPATLGEISVNWASPEIINVSEQLTALSQLRRDNPGLWPDDWYRERIGGLLAMSSQQIKDEGERAKMESRNSLDMLINSEGQGLV